MARTTKSRAELTRDIRQLDQCLTQQQSVFRSCWNQSMTSLQRIHPLWLVSTGFIAGVIAGHYNLRGYGYWLRIVVPQLTSRTGV